MKKITCCNGCVAPKRYPGCQDHCPDLHTERILKIVEEADQMNQKRIDDGLKASRMKRVEKAVRKRGQKWLE